MKMVAINIIPEQDELVPGWLEKHGYDFTVLLGAEQGEIMQRYAILATPTTFVLDSDGYIILRIDGAPPGSAERIDAAIEGELAR